MHNLMDLIKVMNENIQTAEFENEHIINHIYQDMYSKKATLLDMSDYTSNPYFLTVTAKEAKYRDLTLFYDHYKKNQMFLADELAIKENYKEKSSIGYFDMPFEFLALKKGEKIWMSVTPHEINTMAKPIERAKGKVLVLGLGLGYFPFMISRKEEVTEITVVENDPGVIALFKNEILPYFPHKEKIHIQKGDAFRLKQHHSDYDFIFADLWHQPREALPMYFRLRRQEAKGTEYAYWIETSILSLLRRCVLIVHEEIYYGATDEDFIQEENDDDHLINAVYKAMAKTSYNVELDDASLKRLAKKVVL